MKRHLEAVPDPDEHLVEAERVRETRLVFVEAWLDHRNSYINDVADVYYQKEATRQANADTALCILGDKTGTNYRTPTRTRART